MGRGSRRRRLARHDGACGHGGKMGLPVGPFSRFVVLGSL